MRVKCPWRRSSPLLDGGFAMSDSGLEKTQTKMSDLADKVKFTWVSLPMVFHACAATGLSAAVYLGHSVLAFPLSPGAFLTGHVLLGAVLGLLLVGRWRAGYRTPTRAPGEGARRTWDMGASVKAAS